MKIWRYWILVSSVVGIILYGSTPVIRENWPYAIEMIIIVTLLLISFFSRKINIYIRGWANIFSFYLLLCHAGGSDIMIKLFPNLNSGEYYGILLIILLAIGSLTINCPNCGTSVFAFGKYTSNDNQNVPFESFGSAGYAPLIQRQCPDCGKARNKLRKSDYKKWGGELEREV